MDQVAENKLKINIINIIKINSARKGKEIETLKKNPKLYKKRNIIIVQNRVLHYAI